MKKIPTLFQRTKDRRHVIDEVTPGCEWVLEGEGRATRKFDGTCVRADGDHTFYFRREVKAGQEPPPYFEASEHDPETGKTVGWEPATESGFVKFLIEALEGVHHTPAGTYELCGPKINGNPEGFDRHVLIRHGDEHVDVGARTFDNLRDWLMSHEFEGIVWHHPDGRMAKLKRRDFPRDHC